MASPVPAEFRAEEITVSHAGGWANLTPGCSKYEDLPPLKVAGAQTDYQSAMAAAAVSLTGVNRAQRTGHGEYIDLPKMSYTATMFEASFVFWSYLGEIAGRLGTRLLNPWKIVSTSDGLVFVVCVEEDQWGRLKEIMGHPEWAELEIFDSLAARFDNDDLLHLYIDEWTSQFPMMELFHRGQSVRVALAPVNTVEQMSEDEHLEERGFLCLIDQPGVRDIDRPGAPYRLEWPWWGLRTPAPRQGEHKKVRFSVRERRPVDIARIDERPLAGVTIADFLGDSAGIPVLMKIAEQFSMRRFFPDADFGLVALFAGLRA